MVPFHFPTYGASDAVADPTAVPTIDIYDDAGAAVVSGQKASVIVPGKAGWFYTAFYLGVTYSPGFYAVHGSYTVSGTTKRPLWFFEVIPGGDAQGTYNSLTFYDKTGGDYLAGETNLSGLEIRQGPYL